MTYSMSFAVFTVSTTQPKRLAAPISSSPSPQGMNMLERVRCRLLCSSPVLEIQLPWLYPKHLWGLTEMLDRGRRRYWFYLQISGALGTAVVVYSYVYMGPVSWPVFNNHHQAIHSIICCAYNHYYSTFDFNIHRSSPNRRSAVIHHSPQR
jgi:hypothetical protein